MKRKSVIVFGAGPAGLAAGLKLVNEGFEVTLIEQDSTVGGISKTVKYKGNRFDIGGHRFFTKSTQVQKLWQKMLGKDFKRTPRLSRIYYRDKFFKYPIELKDTLSKAGLFTSFTCLASFIKYKILPITPEQSFADWVTNQFGKKLFLMFFKSYTEKVWGISTKKLSAEWAKQRIQGLSLFEVFINAVLKPKQKAKSLIEEFYYPKYGPGMMYEAFAEKIKKNGGRILLDRKVDKIFHSNQKIKAIRITTKAGLSQIIKADFFISTIPLPKTIQILSPRVPLAKTISRYLKFRDFISVNLIIYKKNIFPDNWIYIHDPSVRMGRIQNYKNWSLDMASNNDQTPIGCEYFCNKDDRFWHTSDKKLIELAKREIDQMGLAKDAEVSDAMVYRMADAYPVYTGQYQQKINESRKLIESFENLYCAGRGGLFRYNNMDHSILSGLYAARSIMGEKTNPWEVNAEDEYHENRTPVKTKTPNLLVKAYLRNPLLWQRLFLCLFFILLFAFQTINLDGDPSPIKTSSDIADEGYWVHNARSKALLGTFLPDQLNQAFMGAPLFNFLLLLTFKVFGVSLFSARLLALACFWLTLLMLFKLLKDNYSIQWAYLGVLTIGVINDFLIYARWSTPITLEIMCLVAIIFFFDRAIRTSKQYFFALAGAFYPMAIAAKLSSVYFAVSLLLFLILMFFKKSVKGKNLLWFFLGLSISLSALLIYVGLNFQEFKFFSDTIGAGNLTSLGNFNTAFNHFIRSLENFRNFPYFFLPSVSLLTLCLILAFYEMLRYSINSGWKSLCGHLQSLEIYALVWIVGFALTISASPDQIDRRFIQLMAPISIIFIAFISGKFTAKDKNYSNFEWLNLVAFVAIFNLAFNSFYARFPTAFSFTLAFANHSVSRAIHVGTFILLIILTFFSIIKPNLKVFAIFSLATLISVNLFIDIYWFKTDRKTINSSTQRIETYLEKNNITQIKISGPWAHEISIGSQRLIPIWYLKNPIGSKQINNLFWTKEERMLLIDETFIIDQPPKLNPDWLSTADFTSVKAVTVSRLCVKFLTFSPGKYFMFYPAVLEINNTQN